MVSWVTHETLIVGQLLGACAYTLASHRLWCKKFGRLTVGALSTGVALDVLLAVLGTTSDLGDNPNGTPWRHPLFIVAAVLATLGMLGYMLNLVLMLVRPWRFKTAAFFRYSQLVVWPSWMIGVMLFILNVFGHWF